MTDDNNNIDFSPPPIILYTTLSFILLYLFFNHFYEYIEFLYLRINNSNSYLSYLLDNSDIYCGPNIGIERLLKLDSPSISILYKRIRGQSYLNDNLGSSSTDSYLTKNVTTTLRESLASKLVDDRYTRSSNVLCPLFCELEFPCEGRTFIIETKTSSYVRDGGLKKSPTWQLGFLPGFPFPPSNSSPISNSFKSKNLINSFNKSSQHQLFSTIMENGTTYTYVGNDPIYTLGKNFYDEVQEKINVQMSLYENLVDDNIEKKVNNATLRFVPTSFTPELELNVSIILDLTGMDQVRYSLGGSEAIDAAFKDIKSSCYNKKTILRFRPSHMNRNPCSYGIDNSDYSLGFGGGPKPIFLDECSAYGLSFIERYHFRIAAVVVDPMMHYQHYLDQNIRSSIFVDESKDSLKRKHYQYTKWLHQLMDKCNYCTKYLTKVAFVIDDRHFALRMPELFSTEFFTHPDTGKPLLPNVLVIGNGIAAGYPLSMVLGQKGYLNTYDKKFLLKVNKTVGTFAAWHGGIVASNVFLKSILSKEDDDSVKHMKLLTKGKDKVNKTTDIDYFLKNSKSATSNFKVVFNNPRQKLRNMILRCDSFCVKLNARFHEHSLPIHIRNFSNVFTIQYMSNSLYNSRYTQYLMAEGIYLQTDPTSVGFQFHLNADATENCLSDLADKFVSAGITMKDDGYFETFTFCAMVQLSFYLSCRCFFNWIARYYNQIMTDKRIDIDVSHNHPVNKFGHFWSSVFMILVAYPYILMGKPLEGCLWFFLTHVVRQSGHFFYEHQDKNIEKLKFGHKDRSKKEAVVCLLFSYLLYSFRSRIYVFVKSFIVNNTNYIIGSIFRQIIGWFPLSMEQYISLVALFTVVPHFVEITHQYGLLRGISWFLKILTDPFTDIFDFYHHAFIHPKWFLVLKNHSAVYKLDLNTKKVMKVKPL